ncbi:MAG: corrinoid transporter substrate-binding protein [Acidobacteria bacterium]|nr:corrinoid transporter substrate-binding protein [Acidobacteriota bacterium]
MAGGHNLFGEAGRHSPRLEWLEVTAADPEVILVLPCGFDIARTRQELPALTRRPGWENLRAVREGRVVLLDGNQYFNRPGPRLAELLDGNQYFNRPGPRLVESLEILAEILHPEVFSFGHEGTGWELVRHSAS